MSRKPLLLSSDFQDFNLLVVVTAGRADAMRLLGFEALRAFDQVEFINLMMRAVFALTHSGLSMFGTGSH